jgi:hypothetical protein
LHTTVGIEFNRWWKLCHPSLGLKAELQMESFAKRDFRARFDVIRSAPPPAAGYMLGNL